MGTDAVRDVSGEGNQQIAEPVILKSGRDYYSRIAIGTPTLGTIRMEWHQARVSQTIPVNWSNVTIMQAMGGYTPLGFLVADAQNIIVKHVLEKEIEWLLFWEDDVLPPMDAFIWLNHYMIEGDTPVVSGLYYTKSRPAEPLVFRGRGNGFYANWEPGDKVWADGVPTGFLLIHCSILRAMWPDCEEYTIQGQQTRRMFRFPRDLWQDPESGNYQTLSGTSDLDWCQRVMEGDYFAKAGWDECADKQYPFLVDTRLSCGHINMSGEVFP